MTLAEKEANRKNYAETFALPLDRIGWRECKHRSGSAFHLYIIRPKGSGTR
jgi:hypothetical protein